MTDRRERIPADEVGDPKRWNLPFWTEPKHVVHSEEHEEEDVTVEEAEVEVEPLTAEQLETIRQEAFNEGLEQGLIEGRQKGEKLGYDEGHAEGFKQGEQEGKRLGFDAGFETGEKQAFQNGTLEQEKIAKRFQALLVDVHQQLSDSKQQLLNDIPDIILAMAKAVITEELSQGSEHIVTLVQQALDALPLESGELKIEVNPQDLPFVEAAIEQDVFAGVARASSDVEAGGCRIHTRYSSVDFTLSERWGNIEKQYRHHLQLALNQDETEAEPEYLNEDMTQGAEALSTEEASTAEASLGESTQVTKTDQTQSEDTDSLHAQTEEETVLEDATELHNDSEETNSVQEQSDSHLEGDSTQDDGDEHHDA